MSGGIKKLTTQSANGFNVSGQIWNIQWYSNKILAYCGWGSIQTNWDRRQQLFWGMSPTPQSWIFSICCDQSSAFRTRKRSTDVLCPGPVFPTTSGGATEVAGRSVCDDGKWLSWLEYYLINPVNWFYVMTSLARILLWILCESGQLEMYKWYLPKGLLGGRLAPQIITVLVVRLPSSMSYPLVI